MSNSETTLFDDDARSYLKNTLNEVVNGIYPTPSIEKRIAFILPAARELLLRWMRTRDDIGVSAADARILLETASICEADFNGDEFQTRLGYTRVEAETVMARLQRIVDAAPRQLHAAAS